MDECVGGWMDDYQWPSLVPWPLMFLKEVGVMGGEGAGLKEKL